MRRLFVATAMLCSMMCLPVAMMGQTTAFRFVQDGEFASVSQSTGLSGFNLQVSRGLTTSAGPTASLQYSSFSIASDGSSITFSNAFGPIPPGDFTGQNVQNLALSIDTTTLGSTFSSETCTVLLVNPFTVTCGAGPTGVISLQFTENNAQSVVVHAFQQEVTNGPVTTRTHQRSDNSTANAQGSVFGTTVTATAFATVGVNHLSSIEMIHN